MNITVLLFSQLRDELASDRIVCSVSPGATVRDVIEDAARRYPQLHAWKDHIRVAVNHEYASAEARLGDGDELAFITPVSGG